jgi:hypothetical protein
MKNLKVRNIIESKGDYSHVVISRENFDAVNGFKPQMAYTTSRDAAGRGIRVFDFSGVNLFARRDKENGKTVFIMKTTDAAERLETLEQERAGEPTLAFAF